MASWLTVPLKENEGWIFWVSRPPLCAFKYRTTEFSFPQMKPTRKWEHWFVILIKTCNDWQWKHRQMCIVPNRTSSYHMYTTILGPNKCCNGVISGIQISWQFIDWVFILWCNISVFTWRRMSRASGWSTLRGVYWPMTAHFSRCSTKILFKAEKLPGKHSSPHPSSQHCSLGISIKKNKQKTPLFTDYETSSSSGGFGENISGTNSVSRAALVQHRGSGGWENALVLTSLH